MAPIETGGRISQALGGAIGSGFDLIVLAIFKMEARCDRAKQAVRSRTSVDTDFLSDEEMKDRLADLDASYIESRKLLVKTLVTHQGVRNLHINRKALERRARAIAEAERRFL